MPESSLLLTYDEIRQRVGKDYGYRTTIENWTEQEKEDIEFCVRDGSDMFYTKSGHEWSFLEPFVGITILTAAIELELPWDFGFLVEDCIYFDDSPGRIMRIVNDGIILRHRQDNLNTTGRPMHGAIVVEGKPGGVSGQKSKLIWWPASDQDYDAQIRYSILPNALAVATPIPYGGAAHSGTIMQACLAAKERREGYPMGPHNQSYSQALEASKAYDRKIKPRVLAKGRGSRGKVPNVVTYVPGPNP